jgi:hypothetical protein
MKQLVKKTNRFNAIMLCALAVGCTTTTQTENKVNLLMAAGAAGVEWRL